MTEDSQIVIPPSFIELFVMPGDFKPRQSREHIAQRYELCEDLAQMLTEPAKEKFFDLGITQADVLGRMLAGLAGSVVEEPEARWVVRRLAELLDWEALPQA